MGIKGHYRPWLFGALWVAVMFTVFAGPGCLAAGVDECSHPGTTGPHRHGNASPTACQSCHTDLASCDTNHLSKSPALSSSVSTQKDLPDEAATVAMVPGNDTPLGHRSPNSPGTPRALSRPIYLDTSSLRC